MQKGKLLYSTAFGLADLESHEPITADTQFDVASMSKQFTAASLFFLIEIWESDTGRFGPPLYP